MPESTHPEVKMSTDTPFAGLAGEMTEMQKDAIAWMTNASATRFGGLPNLAAHPMGAVAAASAIGMGMASQMFGIFAGSMAGAMQAANMLANETTGGPPAPFGLVNPMSFDLATGSFADDKTEQPEAVAAPVVEKVAPKPVAAHKPVAGKLEAKTPAAKTSVAKKTETKEPEAKVVGAKTPAVKKSVARKPAAKTVAAAPAVKAKAAPAKPAKAAPAAAAKPEPVALAEPKAAAPAAPETVMPEDFVKPKALAKPEKPDDLKAISGVGPKLESVLNSIGLWTYEQIAALTPYEVAWVDDYLQFKGRIQRDGWIEQAAQLAKKG